jgi:DNA primase
MTKESLSALFGREFTSAKDNWKGKCPFHAGGNERTPSFFIHKEEYIAHCFGCDISGTVSNLASLYTGKTETQCAELLGITLETKIRRRIGVSQEDDEGNGETQKRAFFPESWLAAWPKEIHNYVSTRGFSTDTLRRAETRYDRRKRRQVFPWISGEGRVVGATGRDCSGESSAKWFHYWDFERGDNIYCLPHTRFTSDRLLVVEGIFDLLWVYQETANENIVAPVAAQISNTQAKYIKRNTTSAIIAFDNDEAGIKGTVKANRLLRSSIRLHFIKWPEEAKDWMDLDGEQIDTVLRRPLSFLQWKQWIRDRELEHLIV